ncbi:MAG: zinc ribbon domain-containing protein, partial [Kiritimatiellae bacterium]|nr:zinc ribbon domain-containing protein [Kiritimatiellia bacterium]
WTRTSKSGRFRKVWHPVAARRFEMQKASVSIAGRRCCDRGAFFGVGFERRERRGWQMPIYEYRAREGERGCPYCISGFECLQRLSDKALTNCPKCGAPIVKLVSCHAVGRSQSGFDDRARSAGFHKLKRIGKGEYEKQY